MLKKLIPFIAAAVIAVTSYFTYQTPLGDALQIAFNEGKAKEACNKLLEDMTVE